MEKWRLDLVNEKLDKAYRNYLFKVDSIVKYYLSCVAFDQFTIFLEGNLDEEIRASDNFHECATSIRKLGDIKALRDTGEFAQLSRSQCIISIVSAFTDFFEQLLDIAQIKPHEIKCPVSVIVRDKEITIRQSSLKTAYYLSKKFNFSAPLTEAYGLSWISQIICIRHMFIHSQGRFDEEYRAFMLNPWDKMQHGEKIKFDNNIFDSVVWFLCDHLKPFVRTLDSKLSSLR